MNQYKYTYVRHPTGPPEFRVTGYVAAPGGSRTWFASDEDGERAAAEWNETLAWLRAKGETAVPEVWTIQHWTSVRRGTNVWQSPVLRLPFEEMIRELFS